ncbi:hypothetical protein WN51_04611 [Melipona quadrifasciata]|uniref:Uncharacterized protein n=1 Tax=Melipona quadrifasciata TaxID=166423 RepID=A0A0N0U3R3_9HYME|nr:hypothetical protein WN51_04611 [Melipona quadrifasciata]
MPVFIFRNCQFSINSVPMKFQMIPTTSARVTANRTGSGGYKFAFKNPLKNAENQRVKYPDSNTNFLMPRRGSPRKSKLSSSGEPTDRKALSPAKPTCQQQPACAGRIVRSVIEASEIAKSRRWIQGSEELSTADRIDRYELAASSSSSFLGSMVASSY